MPLISRDLRQEIAGAEVLAKTCRIDTGALPPASAWKSSAVLDTFDAPVRVSATFRADERLLESARKAGVISRSDLLDVAAGLGDKPSEDELRSFVLNVHAWGYGTVGFGYSRALKVDGARNVVYRSTLAAQALVAGGPAPGYLALHNSARAGGTTAQHVERWGPVLFTKYLYFRDPLNQPGVRPDRATALPMDRHLAAAMNTLVPSKPLGWFALSTWTAPQYAFCTSMVHRLATQLSTPELTLTPGMVEAVLVEHYRELSVGRLA